MELNHSQRFLFIIKTLSKNHSDFARSIKKSAQAITNITTGKNKCGADILESILITYPQISADWLILGKGEPFKSSLAVDTNQEVIDLKLVIKKMEEMYEAQVADLRFTVSDLRYTIFLMKEIIQNENERKRID